jgi:hypothetical protein
MAKSEPKQGIDTDKFKIGASSARRLSAMSDVPADQLRGLTVAEAAAKFRFEIDPQLFLFRKVCGEVVKTDPVTGVDYPVPFATVKVEDTDSSLLGFFPSAAIWSWFFPFFSHREVIATTRTDACGKFCVWIPRWDIDWVLRFRRERHCFPIIFDRPTLRELIDDLIPREIPPFPKPDPGPLREFDRARLIATVEHSLGRDIAVRLARTQSQLGFGASTVGVNASLDAPAALPNLQPPLPAELKKLRQLSSETIDRTHAADAVHPAVHTLASHLKLNAQDLRGLDLRRYIGPFKRCFDVFVPEWVPILDVPDITFQVLQDTDGDGDEEQIYGESYFQVRWDANPVSPVTIHAWPNALAGVACGPTNIPCGNVPAIVMAGRLPVTGDPTVYDTANGYAVRTNRPHPSGLFSDPLPNPSAASPLAGVLSLYGCNRTNPGATHYRLVYKYSNDNGATFTSFTPFVGLSWPLYRISNLGVGEWHWPSADAAGWYPLTLPAGNNPWLPQDLLLDWPSYSFANGRYVVKLELGTGGVVVPPTSAEVAFNVDNGAPGGPIAVAWSFSAAGPFTPLDGICPVVRRHTTPLDVYFRVTLDASARHLRSAQLWATGCGAGDFAFMSGTGGAQAAPGSTTYQHWHQNPGDNDQVLQVIYKLPSTAAEGTYSFGAHVSSRAFSPTGYDGGHLYVPAWQYDPDFIYIDPSVSFSVFNAA